MRNPVPHQLTDRVTFMRTRDSAPQNSGLGAQKSAPQNSAIHLNSRIRPSAPQNPHFLSSYISTQRLDRQRPKIVRRPQKLFQWFGLVLDLRVRARLPLDTVRAPAHQFCAWGSCAWFRKDRFVFEAPTRPQAERAQNECASDRVWRRRNFGAPFWSA